MRRQHNHGMNPSQRRAVITDLLQEGAVPTQQALAHRLHSLGISATQTTLSRDLAAIGAVKTSDGYIAGDVVPTPSTPTPASDDLGGPVIGASVGSAMLILKTPPAHAHPVARRIDALGDEDILGTIAGDDTVLVATRSLAAARRIGRELFPPSFEGED